MKLEQTLLGVGTVAVGLLLVAGATQISAEAGYSGVGPNFFPWVVGVMTTLCGAWLVWEAFTGGFRALGEPSGADRGHWPGFVWVSVGLLANAALITTIGFILSCTLCFMLAVRGLRLAEGRAGGGPLRTLLDFATGCLIAAPAFWLFTKLLAINLPGLTGTGWL